MTDAKRVLVVLLVTLAMVLSAVPASADPGGHLRNSQGDQGSPRPANVSWE